MESLRKEAMVSSNALLHSRELESRKSACKGVKCELVKFGSLPEYMKDNEFILDYYRCEWPLKETFLSLFSIHNETLNIWTHLMGFFIFLALTIYTGNMAWMSLNVTNMQKLPELEVKLVTTNCTQSSSIANHSSNTCALTDLDVMTSPITRWPFYAFLCGAMLCLLTSSVCHLLSCHSQRCLSIMLRLDYAGISALIVTSFYPLIYYSFMCHAFIRDLYIGAITIIGAVTALATLLPIFQTPKFRLARSGLFFGMGILGLVPIVHKLITSNGRPEAIATAGYEVLMSIFYLLGVAVYVARVPERWLPGRFDLAGHSHQLFHVLVIAGAYTHYLAGLVYIKWRDLKGCN